MPLLTSGLNSIVDRVFKGSTQPFNVIGVGDGAATFSASHTDLTGTNKLRKQMDSGYPKVKTGSANVLEGRVTFDGTEANFNWQEWGLFTSTTGGTMLNRLQFNNSTKLTGQTWIFKVEITLNVE